MKKVFFIHLSVLVCMFAGISDAMAIRKKCPAGCFCLTPDGKYEKFNGWTDSGDIITTAECAQKAQPVPQNYFCGSFPFIAMGYIFCDTSQSLDDYGYYPDQYSYAEYMLSEFSELYWAEFSDRGAYGIIGDEMVYIPYTGNRTPAFQCPTHYPYSEEGAKSVFECFKYKANGQKEYFMARSNITCAEGTYLPANATQCVACNAAQNQVCPGGRFEKLDKIQGLRLNCPTGKYLPANATQCSSCDESQYFCFGGIYDYNSTEDQGRIAHNGYVNMGAMHTFITCNPGKYVPANTNQCSACTGDYICPGGIFFTDATYNVDRGKKLCPYGQPNATHTACVGKSSKPSYAREHLSNVINKPAESTSVMKQKIGKNEKVVSVATEKPIADSEETKVSTVNTENTKKSVETKKNIDDSKNVKSSTAEKKLDLGKENIAQKQTVAEEIKASATNTEKTVEVQKDVADSKKVKSSATEKKLDLGKISAPLAPKFDRALTHRPVPVSANIQETTDINSVVHGTMNEKSEQKRPSRYR